MIDSNRGRMIGPDTHLCPFGKTCTCNPTPGRAYIRAKRAQKRRERQAVARLIRLTY